MLGATGICTLLTVSVLLFILGYLLVNGGKSLSWDFFTKLPVSVGEAGGGVAHAIVGSAKILLIAMCVGIPIGFLAGVYVSEFHDRTFPFVVKYMSDLLNGVPSIVIGIFAYTIIVLPMKKYTALAGGIALGIMMVPIALRTTEEFLRSVPDSLREGAVALGAKKWQSILTVVIPAARQGLIAGMMLNLARVAGETAPLIFTSLGNQYWSNGVLEPTAALPVVIFSYAISPYPSWHEKAWAGGFVLLTLILIVNVSARLIVQRGSTKK